MSDRAYINADGSIKTEILAAQQAALATSAEKRGVDPAQVKALLAEVHDNGFVIIPNLVSKTLMASIKAEALPLMTHDGRNEFEGLKTRRIYAVIEKTLALNPLVEHPLILALLDNLLMPNYLLSQLQAINVLPGEVAQPLHADDGFYPIARPRKPFSAATIWAIDDFTADNGATVAIPKSHAWGDEHPGDGSGHTLVPAVMPAGSVLFFLGTLWHGAGANKSDAPRMAATAQYCEPWARQQENYSLAISRERAKQCSPAIQALLGYSMMFPFIGFVNGRDPKRLLE
ncbi:MAG TPA: phytanoyl-CoA dioxygenase family protein [Pseudomonadales bacterium]